MNVYGGFSFIDMSEINKEFTSGTATNASKELSATIVAAMKNLNKPVILCGLNAEIVASKGVKGAAVKYPQFKRAFIPAPLIYDGSTSGHEKWTSTNVTGKVTVTVLFDLTISTGIVAVTVTCVTAE